MPSSTHLFKNVDLVSGVVVVMVGIGLSGSTILYTLCRNHGTSARASLHVTDTVCSLP